MNGEVMNPRMARYFVCLDSRIKELRCGRMEINRFNVVLVCFSSFVLTL